MIQEEAARKCLTKLSLSLHAERYRLSFLIEAGRYLVFNERSATSFPRVLTRLVIGGTVATMLLPVFARVTARRGQAACLANVKAVACAIRMYVSDNDLTFPPVEYRREVIAYVDTHPGGGGKSQWNPAAMPHCRRSFHLNPYLRWPVILDPYVPDREVWRCPSARLERGASFINAASDWLAHLRIHKGEWGRQSDLCPDPSWPAGWGGEVTDSFTQGRIAVPISGKGRMASSGMFLQSIGVKRPIETEKKLTSVEDPSWYVICADGGATVDDFCVGTLAYPDLCRLECAGSGDWEADWGNCPWSRECGAIGAMKIDLELRKPYARHFGGVNIGFLDGHARWFDSEEVIAEAPSRGNPHRGHLRGVEPWGPTRDSPGYGATSGIPPLY